MHGSVCHLILALVLQDLGEKDASREAYVVALVYRLGEYVAI